MSRKDSQSVKQSWELFSDEKTFEKIYEECLENEPQVSEAVRSSYKEMNKAFEEYLSAIQENMFRYAYQCGYEAAVKAILKGGAA